MPGNVNEAAFGADARPRSAPAASRGLYSANEYLTRNNLMKAFEFPNADTPIKRHKNAAVVGGGNVAMDSVRTALRLDADNAYIVYRRGMEELPARKEEVEHAQHEGVQFKILTAPLRFIGNKEGWVGGLESLEMELGEPDASGRRRPIPKEGSNFVLKVDAVIPSIGTGGDLLRFSTGHQHGRGALPEPRPDREGQDSL